MKAFRRSLYAWIALLGFIFSQLAMSAYACPLAGGAASSDQPAAPVSVGDMAGMHCAEMGAGGTETPRSALCVQHCEQGSQAVGASQSLDFHPALFVISFVAVLSEPQPVNDSFEQAPLLVRTTSPPPLWRTGRLRI